jgi:hypothetical protein
MSREVAFTPLACPDGLASWKPCRLQALPRVAVEVGSGPETGRDFEWQLPIPVVAGDRTSVNRDTISSEDDQARS